jgi:hypothetical protein
MLFKSIPIEELVWRMRPERPRTTTGPTDAA